MRVTQSMLSNNMLRNLNTSYGKMSKLQDQITSGKKISRPSDDPVVALKGMNYRTELDKIGQYQRNIGEAHNWLDTSDSSLGQVGDALIRVKELIVQAANDTNTPDDREKIKAEIDQIQEQIRDLANTQSGGKYIFSGTNTQSPMYIDVQHVNPEKLQNHYNELMENVVNSTDYRNTLPDPATAPDPAAAQAAIDAADLAITDAQNQLDAFEKGITDIDNTPDAATGERLYDLEQYFKDYMNDDEKSALMTTTRVINARYTIETGDVENPLDRLTNITLTNPAGTTLTAVVETMPNKVSVGTTAGNDLRKGDVKVEVFDGVQLQVNSDVTSLFAQIDTFMSKVSEALETGSATNNGTDISKLLGGVINLDNATARGTDFGDIHATLLTVRAEVGAKQNRLELMENRLALQEVNVTKQMSDNEDTDYAKAITEMTTAEAIHQASLSVGAKIIQQTLVDFIR